jgi:hypothetical protein
MKNVSHHAQIRLLVSGVKREIPANYHSEMQPDSIYLSSPVTLSVTMMRLARPSKREGVFQSCVFSVGGFHIAEEHHCESHSKLDL